MNTYNNPALIADVYDTYISYIEDVDTALTTLVTVSSTVAVDRDLIKVLEVLNDIDNVTTIYSCVGHLYNGHGYISFKHTLEAVKVVNKLKAVLPKASGKLNTLISTKIKVTDTIINNDDHITIYFRYHKVPTDIGMFSLWLKRRSTTWLNITEALKDTL